MTYSTLMHMACWAAVITGGLGKIQSRTAEMDLAQAQGEQCVVVLGRQLAHLESQVGAYLDAYRNTMEPALRNGEPALDRSTQ